MQDKHNVGKVLLALDISPRSKSALEAATTLAAELDAELTGLFVEDINLQHLVGLPFAREFNLLSGEVRPLLREELERTWRLEAETVQRQLAEAAGRLRLRWSFRVARGKVAAEVNALAEAFDLVVLGKRTHASTMAVMQATYQMANILPKAQSGPVLALYDGMPAARHSLDSGAMLSRLNGTELVLLISAGNKEEYATACATAQISLKERGVAGRCVWLPQLDGPALIEAARREGASCLVLTGKERFLMQAGFDRVLDEIECPVVLVQ